MKFISKIAEPDFFQYDKIKAYIGKQALLEPIINRFRELECNEIKLAPDKKVIYCNAIRNHIPCILDIPDIKSIKICNKNMTFFKIISGILLITAVFFIFFFRNYLHDKVTRILSAYKNNIPVNKRDPSRKKIDIEKIKKEKIYPMLKKSEYDKLIVFLDKTIKENPEIAELYYLKGEILSQKSEAAVKDFEELKKLKIAAAAVLEIGINFASDSEKDKYYYKLTLINYQMNDLTKAAEYIKKLEDRKSEYLKNLQLIKEKVMSKK